jgi:hypothetical protein
LLKEGVKSTFGTVVYSTDNVTYYDDIARIVGTNAGDYTVYYKVVGNDNYEGIEAGSITVNIATADVSLSTIPALAASQLNYTGESQNLLAESVSAIGGTLNYRVVFDKTNAETTSPTGTEIGKYTIYYSVTADSNHNSIAETEIGVIEIVKADPKSTDFTFAAPTSLVYNGNAKEATVTKKSGISGMGGITVKYFDSQGKQLESAPTAVGTYTVKIDVADGDNYNAATDLTDASWKFTISSPSASGGSTGGTVDDKDEDNKDDSEDTGVEETPTVTSPVVVGTTEKLKSAATVTSTKTTQTLSWNAITGADGYMIYGAKCGSKYKLLKTVKAGSDLSFKNTKLKAGTYYKYYVVAYQVIDGEKVTINKSIASHVVTAGGSKANPAKVKVNSTNISVSVAGKKTIKAKAVYENGKTATSGHASTIRYRTSNSKIATVSSKGVVTAKKKGTCYVYCYAINGTYKRVKITVK